VLIARILGGITPEYPTGRLVVALIFIYAPEALFQSHNVNNRGMMVICDELKGWLDNFDRYTKSGEQSMMLSAWSHLPVTVNRKAAGVMHIEKPLINVLGGIQPDLLPSLASDQRAENGFLSRFMVVYPDNALKAEYSVQNNNIREWMFWHSHEGYSMVAF
jgi:hypothetical protein